MSEDEFWGSTVAKVLALRDRMDWLDKRRDYFVADILTVYLNSMRTKDFTHTFTTEEILGARYKTQSVVTTLKGEIPWDVMGIQGDWQGLRNRMKDISDRPTGRKK